MGERFGAFWAGIRSCSAIFPTAVAVYGGHAGLSHEEGSSLRALRRDWRRVAGDFAPAIAKAEKELQPRGERVQGASATQG